MRLLRTHHRQTRGTPIVKSARHQLDILSAYRELGSYRAAAGLCGTTPKTVRRVVERRGRPPLERPPRPRATDPLGALLAGRVRATDGRISAKRLLPAARAAGYAGSARSLRRAVAVAKAAWRIERRVYRPWQAVPGEHLAIDWGSEGDLHVFCAVLVWSRVRFVRFAADESQATTLALLAECLETLGGVPGIVLADRMGCLKGGVVANVVVPAPGVPRLRAPLRLPARLLRGCGPGVQGRRRAPGRVRQGRPRDPGHAVHRPRGRQRGGGRLVRRGQRPGPRRDIRGAGRAPHSRGCRARQPALAAPGSGPDRGAHGRPPADRPLRLGPLQRARRLHRDPGRAPGRRGRTRRLCRRRRDRAAPARRPWRDEPARCPLRPDSPPPVRAIRPRTPGEIAFLGLGPVAAAFLRAAAAAGTSRLAGELARSPTSRRPTAGSRSLAALERALAYRRFRAADVRSILAAGPGVPRHRDPGAQLVIGLPAVPVRPLAAYALEPSHDRGRRLPLAPDLEAALRRLKLSAIRRLAPEVLVTAKVQRWAPDELLRTLLEAELGSTRCLQRPGTPPGSGVPGAQDARRVPGRRVLGPAAHVRLPLVARVDPGPREPRARGTGRDRQEPHPDRAGARGGRAGVPGPLLRGGEPGRGAVPRARRQQRRAADRGAAACRPRHRRRPRVRTARRHRAPSSCSASSRPPTSVGPSVSRRTGRSSPGAASCPSTRRRSPCSTASCTTRSRS